MSGYVRVLDGAIERWPYSPTDLIRENPQTSWPSGRLSAELLAEWGVFPVASASAPAVDRMTQKVVESPPLLVGQQWVQQWQVVALSAQEQVAARKALVDAIVRQTQARLDAFAQTRYYDGILSACTYATSTNAKFAAEGQYCVEARDATWATLYAVLAEVEAGTRPVPGGYGDIEPLLPPLVWPQ